MYEQFNGDLIKSELAVERSKVHVFDRENGNEAIEKVDCIINNYKRRPKYLTNKNGQRKFSS